MKNEDRLMILILIVLAFCWIIYCIADLNIKKREILQNSTYEKEEVIDAKKKETDS